MEPEAGATLPASETSTVGEPLSLAKKFWQNLGKNNREVAEEIARRISLPLVTAFSFDAAASGGGRWSR